MTPTDLFTSCEPTVGRCARGWIACSSTDSPLRIAVIGETEDEALQRYRSRLVAWEALWQRKDEPRSLAS